jgi:hypothetical protein
MLPVTIGFLKFGVKKRPPSTSGAVAKTLLPEPVFVTETRFLEASVATADEGVKEDSCSELPAAEPIFGVIKFGEVDKTIDPVPVGLLEVFIEIFPEEVIGEFETVNSVDNEVKPKLQKDKTN